MLGEEHYKRTNHPQHYTHGPTEWQLKTSVESAEVNLVSFVPVQPRL